MNPSSEVSIVKPFLSSLLAVCVLLFAVGCRHHTIQTIPNNDIATVTELTESIPFSGELTQYHVQEDILRIECIAPGLDTYTLSVILYSLTTDNVLGCVDLGNGDWFTGWTADGFYVASLSQHTIKIYDRTCRLTETKNIPDTLGHLSFFVMNEAADTYFIGVGDTATLYLYDATSETAKNVGHMLFGYQNPLGYRDGYFYLEGEDELLRIHEDANYAQTVYCDSQHLYKFIDMGIGDRGEQFYVVPTDATSAFYLPMHALGEYPVTATSTHFATLTDGTNDTTDIVRIYDLNAKTVQTLQYHDVQSVVLFTEGVLISTYDGTSHRLYRHQTDDPHSVTFTTTAANDVSKTTHTSFATTNAIVAAHMIDVPIISQMPDYPTGCESVSAVMALRYYGESVTVDDFIDDHLPKSAYVYSKDGIYYGPSPFQYFVGNPRSKNSSGCMATVIHHA